MIDEMRRVIVPRMGNEPSPDRIRHLITPILFPAEESPPSDDERPSLA
jgi:hypothetical protein